MTVAIIVIGAILFYKIVMALHRYFFVEHLINEARKLSLDDLRNARNYSRSISFDANRRRSQSQREFRKA